MINATVFKDFILIGVTDQVYEIARQRNKMDLKEMDGNDIEDFFKTTLSNSLLDQIEIITWSGGSFYCLFNLEEDHKITPKDIHKLRIWANAVQEEIMLANTNFTNKVLQVETPKLGIHKEAEHLSDIVRTGILSSNR